MVKHFIQNYKLIITLIGLLALPVSGHAATINAFLDRNVTTPEETFTLTYEANGSPDDDPDFSPLEKDFELLNNSRGNSLTIVNGQAARKLTWSLTLLPKRTGQITIPSIAFGKDRSAVLSINVKPVSAQTAAQNNQNIFLELDVTPKKTAYVQSQILYTVRLFQAVNISNANLTEPQINNADAVLKKLENKQYEAFRNGRRYVVYERRYAIFPQKSGTLNLDPLQFNAQLVQRQRGVFDPFWSGGKRIRKRTKKVTLDIKPVPAEFTANTWLPSSKIRLSETWSQDPPEFIVGEPVTRNLAISAVGLTAAQLPVISIEETPSIKQYADQPALQDKEEASGILGIRQEKIALIPTQAGNYTLPEIKIPWWNTAKNKIEYAILPERSINVKAASNNPNAINNAFPDTATPNIDNNQPNYLPTSETKTHSFWPWLSLFLFIAWVTTLLTWYWQSRQNPSAKNKPAQQPSANLKKLHQQLKDVCLDNNLNVAKNVLLLWAQAQWPEQHPTNLSDIEKLLNKNAQASIQNMRAALYAKDSDHQWQGESLWQAIENIEVNKTKTKETQGLEKLHKI